jgi:Concanavalin A-like lectin/glucanases superfamily
LKTIFLFLMMAGAAIAQQVGGNGVPTAAGGPNCKGVPGGTSKTGCGGVPGSGGLPTAIHFWPMNEGTGTTLVDHIGTTNLTTTNITWGTSTGMGAAAVAQFNGSNAWANAAAVDSTLNFNGTQPMTVSYWANYPSFQDGTVVGNLQTASSYQGWELGTTGSSGNQEDYIVVGVVGSNQMTAQDSGAIAANTATLIVVTYTGNLALSGVTMYLNGALRSITDSSGTLTSGATSTSPLYVGARNNASSFFHGALAFMRVWNTVLTGTQVSALYALGPQ